MKTTGETITPKAANYEPPVPIELDKLGHSPLNPREGYDVDDILDTLKIRGQDQPLYVRATTSGMYEVLDGNRRLEALKKLKAPVAYCVIVTMTDEEAYDFILSTNMHRADFDPLTLGESMKKELTSGKRTIEQLAESTGRNVHEMRRLLQLSELVPALKKMYRSEKIPFPYLMNLCRESAEVQKAALGEIAKGRIRDLGGLRDYLQHSFHVNLSKAPFDLKDASLNSDFKFSCTVCPKRSDAKPSLFPDMEKTATCLDSACYAIKLREHFARIWRKTQEETQKKPVLISSQMWMQNNAFAASEVLMSDKYRQVKEGDGVIGQGEPVPGIFIDGNNPGTVVEIWLKWTYESVKRIAQKGDGLNLAAKKQREQKKEIASLFGGIVAKMSDPKFADPKKPDRVDEHMMQSAIDRLAQVTDSLSWKRIGQALGVTPQKGQFVEWKIPVLKVFKNKRALLFALATSHEMYVQIGTKNPGEKVHAMAKVLGVTVPKPKAKVVKASKPKTKKKGKK